MSLRPYVTKIQPGKAHVFKNRCFWTFLVVESGRNCQKAHLHAKTFHLRPLPRLYDHLLQRNSLESSCYEKPVTEYGRKVTSSRQDLSFECISRSLRTYVTNIQPGKESMTDGRHPESLDPQPLGLGPKKHALHKFHILCIFTK